MLSTTIVASPLSSGFGASLDQRASDVDRVKGCVDAQVLLVGSWRGHHGSFKTIQGAVDSAKPGDWILVGPGDDHERGDRGRRYGSLVEQGAGLTITTPRIHVRRMDRNRVVVDGTKRGAPRCSHGASSQDFGPRVRGKANGRNGVEVFKAAGMSVENLTACNFLEGEGSSGNQICFNFGDGSGKSIPGAFRGAHLNATSTYYATGRPAASYGIFSSNMRGPGTFAHTYASNMNDSSYYIGACGLGSARDLHRSGDRGCLGQARVAQGQSGNAVDRDGSPMLGAWPRAEEVRMAEVIKTATAIVDETGNLVAVLDAAIWPPINSVVEISPPVPVGTAVVRDVRLRVFQHAASIQVTIAAG